MGSTLFALALFFVVIYWAKKKANGTSTSEGDFVKFEVSGRKLFEDESFLVMKTSFFDHSLLVYLFGTIYLQNKATSKVIKLTGEERKFMIAVIGELAQLGIRTPDPRIDKFMHEFSAAVCGRGSALWRFMLKANSPQSTAAFFS